MRALRQGLARILRCVSDRLAEPPATTRVEVNGEHVRQAMGIDGSPPDRLYGGDL